MTDFCSFPSFQVEKLTVTNHLHSLAMKGCFPGFHDVLSFFVVENSPSDV